MSTEPNPERVPKSEDDTPPSNIILKLVAIIAAIGFVANSETCNGTSPEIRAQNNQNAVSAARSEALENCVESQESTSCRDHAEWAAGLMRKKLENINK